jgi:hypothetical protein
VVEGVIGKYGAYADLPEQCLYVSRKAMQDGAGILDLACNCDLSAKPFKRLAVFIEQETYRFAQKPLELDPEPNETIFGWVGFKFANDGKDLV